MNFPINTTADGAAFAVKSGERACFANMTNGGVGGTSPKLRLSWCINCADGCASTLTLHYHKEGWSNFLGTGSSKMLATAVMDIWEV